jgi:transposase
VQVRLTASQRLAASEQLLRQPCPAVGARHRYRKRPRLAQQRAGNARARRGLIQLAWRFLLFQKDSALAQWFRNRTDGTRGARKTTMIVALARKLLIALWRMVTTGEVPQGVLLRQPA